MTIRETINNVLNANENAEKAKREAKRARRNAMLGVQGVVSTITVSVLMHLRWSRKVEELHNMRTDELVAKINSLETKINELEGGVSNDD